MYKLLLFLHLLAAVFAVGPLVGAATTASRALRAPDAAAAASAARVIRIYSYVSVVVVVLGMGLMSQTDPDTSQTVADFGDTWIWLSVVLWLAATAVALGVLVPSLTRAAAEIGSGNPVSSLVGRVAAAGGVVGLIFAVIVVLMVYQPGG